MTKGTVIVIGCGVAGIIVLISMVNTLIRRKNQVEFALASINAQLKKRFDLIPNLVSVVERYMGYEKSVLAELTGLRARVMSGGVSDSELAAVDSQVGRALKSLFAVAERHHA